MFSDRLYTLSATPLVKIEKKKKKMATLSNRTQIQRREIQDRYILMR